MKTDENYEPYGEEWEKEVMKLPKKMIVDMYRNVCTKLQVKDLEIKELEKVYIEACNFAGLYEQRAKEAETEVRSLLKDMREGRI